MKVSHTNPDYHIIALLPEDKDIFSVKEIAELINKSSQFVRDAVRTGKLFGYMFQGSTESKSQARSSYVIYRSAFILYLLQHAAYSKRDYEKQVRDLIGKSTDIQLLFFKKFVQDEMEIRRNSAKLIKRK